MQNTYTASVDAIIQTVCSYYKVEEADLKRAWRTQPFLDARILIYYLGIKHARAKTVYLGRRFNRDHSTVIHGVKKMCDYLDVGDPIVEHYQNVLQLLPQPANN